MRHPLSGVRPCALLVNGRLAETHEGRRFHLCPIGVPSFCLQRYMSWSAAARISDSVMSFASIATPKQADRGIARSEEHTSELQSLMRISYAVFCLKKKKKTTNHNQHAT